MSDVLKGWVPNDEGPLHVYRGGNFTKIAGEGYDENVKEARYLGGAMACMDDVVDGRHCWDHGDDSRPVRNACRLVACWNALLGIPTELIEAADAEALCALIRAERS